MAIWYITKSDDNIGIVKKLFKPIDIINVENKNIVKLPNEKYAKNLAKKICDIKNQNLVISTDLNQESFSNICNILDGRWTFKFLIPNIIEYILKKSEIKNNNVTISLVTNDYSQDNIKIILRIASLVKEINIVTENIEKFEKLEDYLLKELGIAIRITNNKKRALLKSNIIFNLDYKEDEFNKYSVPKKSIIISIKNKINIKSKRFEGINCNFYEIILPEDIKKWFESNNLIGKFNNNVLLESIIYYKNSYEAIENKLKQVKINSLIGNNGKISDEEFLKIFT